MSNYEFVDGSWRFPHAKYGAAAVYPGGKLTKKQMRTAGALDSDEETPDEWYTPFGKVTKTKQGYTKIEYYDGIGPRPIKLKKKYRYKG
tara:strand:+ start:140 stop:406 length:267 start_codon:yes stop_codon:yes gene_type:complete